VGLLEVDDVVVDGEACVESELVEPHPARQNARRGACANGEVRRRSKRRNMTVNAFARRSDHPRVKIASR
jgi:hypothetical protein